MPASPLLIHYLIYARSLLLYPLLNTYYASEPASYPLLNAYYASEPTFYPLLNCFELDFTGEEGGAFSPNSLHMLEAT